MEKILKDVEKVLFATVGTAKVALEKTKEFVDEMSEKGKETVNSCKIKNEELKRDLKNKVDKVVTVEVKKSTKNKKQSIDEVLEVISKMSDEDKNTIKEKLNSTQDAKEE